MGRIVTFTRTQRGGGYGRVRFLHKEADGTRRMRTAEFNHGQCIGEDDLPLPAGVYPRLHQVVSFHLCRGRRGLYAADLSGKDGAPLQTVGQPIQQLDVDEDDLSLLFDEGEEGNTTTDASHRMQVDPSAPNPPAEQLQPAADAE